MVGFAHGWESVALHYRSPSSAAGTNARFGTGESNNHYLLVTSDREASNKNNVSSV